MGRKISINPENRPRVANVIEEGRLGGPQIRIVSASAAMREQVDTIVFLPDRPDSSEFRTRCERAGVKYVAVPLSRLGRSSIAILRYGLTFPLEVWRLANLFRRENVDLVHVSGGAWQYKGGVAGRLAGKPVVWHLNDTSMPGAVRGMFRVLSPLADGFIFASRRSEECYRRLLRVERPMFLLPAPVDTDYFAPGAGLEGTAEAPSEARDERLLVSTVANLNPIKGLETLVRLAAVVAEERADVRFLVIGPVLDSQRDYYRQILSMIEDLGVTNVEFHGASDDPRALLDQTDVYLCTSNAESSPLSVWEAMSMGLPIVSTDVGDVSCYVEEGVSGEIAEVGDVTGLADAVLRLAADPDLRAQYGVNARHVAQEYLDVSYCGQRHVEVYRALLGLEERPS